MKINKILSTILGLSLLLGITSCGDDDSDGPAPVVNFTRADYMGRPAINSLLISTMLPFDT